MFLDNPSGGFKVVYEYASRLAERSHQVTVIHPRNIDRVNSLGDRARSLLWPVKLRLKHRPLVSWVSVHPGVRMFLTADLIEARIPDADAVVATAYQTAACIDRYDDRKGKKFYLIQSYENWNGPETEVRSSWQLPLHKIVISRRLLDVARDLGEADRTDYIPIGLDFSQLGISTPIGDRTVPRVGMLAHPNEIKGTKDGVRALEIAREDIPELQAVLFGTHERSHDLPSWIEYVRLPSAQRLREIYNSCQVFLNPSRHEGWGLPAAEAMACGCALVSTSNGGVDEFAVDGESALLAPIESPERLAAQLLRLLRDGDLRMSIAQCGHEQIQAFTWDRAVDAFEMLLIEKAGKQAQPIVQKNARQKY
jgi:glycosyltransferase involved in cell wall biosynthesis